LPRPSLLQSPLQPLQDNLESQTYETFERDGTKYSTYEEAVYRCLLDRVPQVTYRMLLYCHWRSHTTPSNCAAWWCPPRFVAAVGVLWCQAVPLCCWPAAGLPLTFKCAGSRPDMCEFAVHVRSCVLQEEAESRTTVLMVVGAGRGPLVAASLRASLRAKRQIRCGTLSEIDPRSPPPLALRSVPALPGCHWNQSLRLAHTTNPA
jgi:hypothetical protein